MKRFNIKQLESFFIHKYILYGLHIGKHKAFCKQQFKPYLRGFRNNFAIIKPEVSLVFFKRALKILTKILISRKKILFVGTPYGFDKEFVQLCLKYDHYVLENKSRGLFSNYQNFLKSCGSETPKFKEAPSVIFFFRLPKDDTFTREAVRLNIPLMAFVNTDDDLSGLDFPLPSSTDSVRGGLFIYNFFLQLFKLFRYC